MSTRTSGNSIANNGMKMTIIDYRKHDDFDVLFEDGTVVTCKRYRSFIDGKIAHPTLRISGKNVCKGSYLGCIKITHICNKTPYMIYSCICDTCGLHTSMTPAEILEHECNRIKDITVNVTKLKQLCVQAGISYTKAQNLKNINPELTDEQIIIHYRPDCYINILGELIIPNKEDKNK